MKHQEIARFEAANPAGNDVVPPRELFYEIVTQPRSHSTTVPRRSRGLGRTRFLKICAAVLAVFAIGTGVSWAATGEFPGELIFGHELGEGLSAGEEDATSQDFSVLQPADQNVISELPESALLMLQGLRASPVPPPAGAIPEDLEREFDLAPGTITGVGTAHTEPSGDVAVVAINDQICSFWIEIPMGNCDPVATIEERGQISAGHFGTGGDRVALGFVDDRVAAIEIRGANRRDVPVSNNVFEVTDLPEGPIALVGVDEQGDEVFRRSMP